MATSVEIQKQFDALHRDAERVLTSINSLSRDLGACEKSTSSSAANPRLNLEALKVDLSAVRKRLDDTKNLLGDQAKRIDTQVHESPYPYIAGALGIGALAGWMIERRIYHSAPTVGR